MQDCKHDPPCGNCEKKALFCDKVANELRATCKHNWKRIGISSRYFKYKCTLCGEIKTEYYD